MTKTATADPAVTVRLDLGAFTFTPAQRREDGGFKRRGRLALKATHRQGSPHELMEWLEDASGLLKVNLGNTDVGPKGIAWEGFGDIRSVNWKPAGDRAKEQGLDTFPTVEIALEFSATEQTDLRKLMEFRLSLDMADTFDVSACLAVWQEDLPLE